MASWLFPLCLTLLSAEPPPQAAVLPVRSLVTGPDAEAVAALLTASFTAQLAQHNVYRVISAEEVAALLRHEADRQSMGCTDDGCLAEVAGALGARFMITGEIVRVGSHLLWTERVVDQKDNAVVRSASVRANALASLVGQVEEMARQVLDLPDAQGLQGEGAMKRLGFTSEEDLADFRKHRDGVPTMSTGEALTSFIVGRNAESRRLAVAEGVALTSSAVFLSLSGTALVVGWIMVLSSFNALAALTFLGGALLFPLGVTLAAVGAALVVLDMLNLQRVTVREDGCCVDQAALKDAESPDGVQQAAAVAAILAGPLSAGLALGALFLAVPAVRVLNASGGSERYATAADRNEDVFGVAAFTGLAGFACAPIALLLPCCLATPAGLWMLLWPTPPARTPVDDDVEAAS